MTKPSDTTTNLVLGRVTYSLSSRRDFPLWDSRTDLVFSTIVFSVLFPIAGNVCLRLKNTDGRKKTHSVLKDFAPFPMCISSPNCLKWSYINCTPFASWSWSSNGKALLSIYKTLKNSSRVPSEKVLGACLVRLPLSLGEFVRVLNVIILWPNCFQLISSVSANSMIINK